MIDELSDSSRDGAVKQLGYYRQMLRSTHSREDLQHYALALAREIGPDAIGDDFLALKRPDDYKVGEDPLEGVSYMCNIRFCLK